MSVLAVLPPNTECGANARIAGDVHIGEYCVIGSNVVIHAGTIIGDGVRIDDNSVIGKLPMRSVASAARHNGGHGILEPCIIGDRSIIGALVVLYRGARIGEDVLIADQASVREQTSIGAATIIGRGVAVENQVVIGARCKIETGAYITALSSIADHCFVAPEVTFTNDRFMARTRERFLYHRGVTMLRGARIGANATVLPGLTLGEDAMVAAASVVTRDVPARTLVMGCPARSRGPVPAAQLLENQ